MANAAIPNRNDEIRSRQWQFSLRTLLVIVTVVAVAFALGLEFVILIAAVLSAVYFARQGQIRSSLGIVGILIVLWCFGVGYSLQVRLDTGDRRVCFWGVPVSYDLMSSEVRQAWLSLDDRKVPKRWVWCATQVGTNHVPGMVAGFYYRAAAWVEEDRKIAKLVLRDLADYLDETHGTHGLPECMPMIWPDVIDTESSNPTVIDGWEKASEVQRYLAAKGYSPQ